jgi:hypothetical protein
MDQTTNQFNWIVVDFMLFYGDTMGYATMGWTFDNGGLTIN